MASSSDHGEFFEGTEKLLEVWFAGDESADLRTIVRKDWESMLEHVHCQVLSTMENDSMIAFVLSESSMFISKDRFILKTCGRTTLLAAVKPLLQMARDQCGFIEIRDVFYSRKNFLRPELQHTLHKSFEDEVLLLEEIFQNGGTAYALGRINKDCWYLYTIDNVGVMHPDQTLEILMQDLDQEKMALFRKDVSGSAKDATARSGIADLIPGARIDDFLFEPCGYSMNGILPDGQYFTIHITPEAQYSYVSFETNVSMESYDELILKIVNIFKPGKFLMTVFTNEVSEFKDLHKELQVSGVQKLGGYQRMDHQYCQLKNYHLTYMRYCEAQKTRLARVMSLGDIPVLDLKSVQAKASLESVPSESAVS